MRCSLSHIIFLLLGVLYGSKYTASTLISLVVYVDIVSHGPETLQIFKHLFITRREFVTMLRCSDWGERSPASATFSILCGARLSQRATLPGGGPPRPTGPTIRLRAAEATPASAAQTVP